MPYTVTTKRNTFVLPKEEDAWMQKHTSARYANDHIFLTEEDTAMLKNGWVLVTGSEYGITVQWDDKEGDPA